MRQWRVGTFSLGLLLIALGVILLISSFSGYDAAAQIINWWPLLLIVLGLEILLYLYCSKQEQPKILYDVFSIFMIVIIALIALGFYTLTTSGFFSHASNLLLSKSYPVLITPSEIEVTPGVEKIVMEAPSYNFSIKANSENRITVSGKGELVAPSKEEADNLAGKSEVTATRVGDTLLVQFAEVPRMREFNLGAKDFSYTIFLPACKEVEIKRSSNFHSPWEIDADAVRGDWLVNGNGRLNINVNKDADLVIEVKECYGLTGNTEWAEEPKTTDGRVSSTLKFGEGLFKLTVINRGEIQVNNLN